MVWLLAIFLAAAATPADAAPVVTAITAIAGTISAATASIGIVGRLAIWGAVTAIQRARERRARERAQNPAIVARVSSTGGVTPLSFIVGRYATAGHREAPPMVHGSGGQPREFLNYVISVSDVPGCALSQVWINGKAMTPNWGDIGYYGAPGAGEFFGKAWVRFYDGTQLVADTVMRDKYGSATERPWLADMVGVGICYAVMTFRYDRDVFQSLPEVLFEVDGITLYDPRKDSTVGGSGAHRWGDRATYERSSNPMVIAYNAARGIDLPGIGMWGGGYSADDLPLSWWFAAMNECDVLVDNGAGGTERQYRMGLEVAVDSAPADLLSACAVACNGRFVEQGGVLKPRVGGPGLPVLAISDADIMVTAAQEERPFPTFDSVINSVSASYPDPALKWAPVEGVLISDSTAVSEDGQELVADVSFAAVPYAGQVERLSRAMLKEERRFRRYTGVLAPDCLQLEPLDAVAFTSPARGFVSKVFEVVGTEETPAMQVGVSLRELDPADYVPAVPTLRPAPSIAPEGVANATVPSFAVAATTVQDSAGTPRRPAIAITWDGAAFRRDQQIEYLVQTPSGAAVASGIVTANAGATIEARGLVASSAYRVSARLFGDPSAVWTAWASVTTPATGLAAVDLAANALTAPAYYSFADVWVATSNPISAPVLMFAQTVTGLSGGAIRATVSFYADGTHGVDAFGVVLLRVNGVEVQRQRFGIRTSGGDTLYCFPVLLDVAAFGASSAVISAEVWNARWDNDSLPNNPFACRTIRLVVWGSRR